jgi:hypothetical protein
LQKPELHDYQEQEEAPGPPGDKKILQYLPEAYGASRSEVTNFGNEPFACQPGLG